MTKLDNNSFGVVVPFFCLLRNGKFTIAPYLPDELVFHSNGSGGKWDRRLLRGGSPSSWIMRGE